MTTDEIILKARKEDVLDYIDNPKNYLPSNINLEADGKSAYVDIPIIGETFIETWWSDSTKDRFVVDADSIGVQLTADIKEESPETTKVSFELFCKPKLGFFKNAAINTFSPSIINVVKENLRTKFEEI